MDSKERLCPTCQVPLVPQSHLGITIDVCPTCAGIWFDADELGRLREIDPAALPRLDQLYQPAVERYEGAGERFCPACRAPMYRYNYLYTSNITLDSCDACGGVWVDHGELIKMDQRGRDARAMEIPPEAKAQMAVAQMEAEMKEAQARARFWEGLFSFLRARPRFPL
ncbi:MAG: zf-TFIIB domain-containing protein [Fimbriimonadales bacterium]|nr:zf-TFIIB domain-containing protein [Fimbriimonadales bacterium]